MARLYEVDSQEEARDALTAVMNWHANQKPDVDPQTEVRQVALLRLSEWKHHQGLFEYLTDPDTELTYELHVRMDDLCDDSSVD